jgi:hypothetical protein
MWTKRISSPRRRLRAAALLGTLALGAGACGAPQNTTPCDDACQARLPAGKAQALGDGLLFVRLEDAELSPSPRDESRLRLVAQDALLRALAVAEGRCPDRACKGVALEGTLDGFTLLRRWRAGDKLQRVYQARRP